MSFFIAPTPSPNPTDRIDLDFAAYARRKRIELSRFVVAGRPDYAFSGDYRVRATLGSFGPLRLFAEALTASWASEHRHHARSQMAQATPRQFAKLFELARDCSQRLDLPVPTLFVDAAPVVNAYTIATDDRAPIVVLSAGCANAMEEDELRFVIGHECGHVQNLHGVYNVMAVIAGNTALRQTASWFSVTSGLISLAQRCMRLGIATWSRAAEITCDRAGALCVVNPRSASVALAKLAAPVHTEKFGTINPEEIVLKALQASHAILRLEEATHSHPLIGKRILAIQRFLETDVFAARRPELAHPSLRTPLRNVDAEIGSLLGMMYRAGH